jgi:hypothetical protein
MKIHDFQWKNASYSKYKKACRIIFKKRHRFLTIMTIEPVVVKLRNRLNSISTGSKNDFLKKFSVIHARWHHAEMMDGIGTFNGSTIGFLSFHHEVIRIYIGKFNQNLTAGSMAKPSPPYRKLIDSISDSLEFSHALEGWHGLVHMNPKYGPNFGNPTKNIYMPRFWNFHKFIEDKFLRWLEKNKIDYNDINHTMI